jgi:cap1 methyltransferase
MLRVLSEGGHFICKLFDTYSYFSLSLIYVCCLVFENTYIVKPYRSRGVNSERFVNVGCF